MKKALIMLTAALVVGSTFQSCKKGENDPFLSLKSRKGRLTGTWNMTISSRTNNTTTDSDNYSDTNWDIANGVLTEQINQTILGTAAPAVTNLYNYTVTLTIEKDGTYTMTVTMTQTSDDGNAIDAGDQSTYTTTTTGNWEFIHKNKDQEIKNKEGVVMTPKTVTDATSGAIGNSSDVTTYTGSQDGTIWMLDQLKNKEMITMSNWTVSNSGGGSSAGSETSTWEKQ